MNDHDNNPAYRLALLDEDFLRGPAMRGVRLQLEAVKADEALRAARVGSTIVVFGGARIAEDGPGHHARWYAEARRFGQIASMRGGALEPIDGWRENVIATGGGPGIMEAANRGAHDVGAPSIGFNIQLPQEQHPNRYSTPNLTFQFHYFAIRKLHLAMRARALVVFPGGFGTLDELFEILTLRQTGRTPAVPVVLVDSAHWRGLINWQAFQDAGLIGEADMGLLHFVDDAEAAWAVIAAHEPPVLPRGPGVGM